MNKKMKLTHGLAASLLLLFGFFGCSSLPSLQSAAGGLPRGAEKAALTCASSNSDPSREYRDRKVACSEQVEVTAAEKANGLDEKWCVDVSSIFRTATHPAWDDARGSLIVYKEHGTWKAEVFRNGDSLGLCRCSGEGGWRSF